MFKKAPELLESLGEILGRFANQLLEPRANSGVEGLSLPLVTYSSDGSLTF